METAESNGFSEISSNNVEQESNSPTEEQQATIDEKEIEQNQTEIEQKETDEPLSPVILIIISLIINYLSR